MIEVSCYYVFAELMSETVFEIRRLLVGDNFKTSSFGVLKGQSVCVYTPDFWQPNK